MFFTSFPNGFTVKTTTVFDFSECCPNQFLCDRKGGIGKCLPFDLLDNNVTDCLDQTDETVNNERSCEVLEERSIKEKVPNQSYYYTCQTVPNGSQVGKCVAMQTAMRHTGIL
uniref:Uncharacterized protein n=1 Tax=Romanomermis culicivorax TaxID=13658 RepID=A0A915I337_ROMCU